MIIFMFRVSSMKLQEYIYYSIVKWIFNSHILVQLRSLSQVARFRFVFLGFPAVSASERKKDNLPPEVAFGPCPASASASPADINIK